MTFEVNDRSRCVSAAAAWTLGLAVRVAALADEVCACAVPRLGQLLRCDLSAVGNTLVKIAARVH
jgi:hypothetical protein